MKVWKLKLKFNGPNVVSTVTRTEPLRIGHAISFSAPLQTRVPGSPALDEIRRLWELERAFNELTTGRVHIDIVEEEEAP